MKEGKPMNNTNPGRAPLSSFDEASEISFLDADVDNPRLRESLGRALQALRDIRHRLSPQDVQIVDAVLEGPTFGEGEGGVFVQVDIDMTRVLN